MEENENITKLISGTYMNEIKDLEASLQFMANDIKEIRKRVDIIGHNQKEFNRFIHLLNDVSYTMRNYRTLNNLSFWQRLKFLFSGKL